jgi:hypothetical protein
MKILIAAFAALILAVAPQVRAQFVTVSNFEDVQFWTGSGPNRSVLLMQFGAADAPATVAWGYHWSGSATAASMIFAVAGNITGSGMPSPLAGADARLTVDGTYFASFDGYFLNSITYNQVGLPAPWSQSVRLIEDNWDFDGTYPSLYLQPGNGNWTGNPFAAADVGISGISLTDGGWIGFAQTDGADPYVFSQPVSAVPEPSTLLLLGLGALVLVGWRIRLRRV